MASEAVLSVKRFTLVESTTLSNDQFTAAAKRQWLAGVHRLSLQIVAATAKHPLGSSPPQHMSGITLPLDGLLAVPVSRATSFPLLIKVVAHPSNSPGMALGIATVDPSGFFEADACGDNDGQPLHADPADLSSEPSFAMGRKAYLTVPVFPVAGLRPETVHAVVAIEITWSNGPDGSPARSLMPSNGVSLEHAAGPLRLSTLDLYFPAFCNTADGLVVSNVVCACNVSTSGLWVNIQAYDSSYSATPGGGLVLRPGQRAYFAITFVRKRAQPGQQAAVPLTPTSGKSAPGGFIAAGQSARGSSAPVELFCVEVDTREAHPPVAFRVHDDAPRMPEELTRPYHLWLNGSCLTNRPLPSAEGEYVRAVLPVFSEDAAATASGQPEFNPDSSVSVVPAGAAVAHGVPWHARLSSASVVSGNAADDDAGLDVRDADSGANVRVPAGGRTHHTSASPQRLMVDVANRVCRCSIKLGVIVGTAIPAPRVCGPFQPGYRVVVAATHPSWTVERGETPVVLPHPATGDIDLGAHPIVVRKAVGAEPHQCLRITLMEVTNAAPSGSAVPTVSADDMDEVPIALGVVTVWPLHRSPMIRALPLSLLFLDSFSRYDEMQTTGVALRGSDITFVPVEGGAASQGQPWQRRR
jgi:hypothetical protein